MNKPNFGRELKETTKDFSLWTISTLLEGLFIALWIFIQWVVNNKIIAPLKLNSVEQMIVLIFQIIFAINLIAQVLIMIYRNIRILLVRTNYTISAETNNEINSNEFKIEDKKHIKNKLTRTFQLFFPSLGAFIVSVLTGIAILLLIIFLSNNKSFEYAHILFYLILPEFLVLYCIFTTKTSNTSFNFLGQQIIKRLFDVIVSVLILFFMLPVILIISVVIKLDSHGPIIYSSKRIGQFGVPFDRYIFRTIYADNKITYIGKFLRKTSLDELPALYNVLVGEMSLIGPRPRLPIHLINGLDFEKQILLVKPGITGLSQIRIASILSYQEIIFLDLDYVKKWSLLLDAKIFFKTIQVVLLGYRK